MMNGSPCSEIDALDLLNEDCWKEILKRVKNSEDLKSCSETCRIFEEILQKQRNEFMLSLILPYILEYLPGPDFQRFDVLQQSKALLKCRLVCKRWRNSIDGVRDPVDRSVFLHNYRFYSGESIDRFLQKFATHTGNPFLGRSVALYLRSPLLLTGNHKEGLNAGQADPQQTFNARKLLQLVEHFGKEIRNVEVLESTRHAEHLAFCKNVRTVLAHLTNLRTMNICCNFDRKLLNAELGHQEVRAELTNYIGDNPLPDLPHLKHLKVPGPNVVLIQLILEKYASQLKSLVVGNPGVFPEQGSKLCNLERLELNRLDASTSLHCLRQLQSPLKSLSLRVTQNRNNVEVWAIDELFRNIQHLPIQRLNISSRKVFLGESGPIHAEQRPCHGSICSVFAAYESGSISWNFLSYCPNLESICLSRDLPRQGIPAGHPNGVAEWLDVNDLMEQNDYDLYQSRIWETIVNLKSFAIYDPVRNPNGRYNRYKRVEYEKRKLQNAGLLLGEFNLL